MEVMSALVRSQAEASADMSRFAERVPGVYFPRSEPTFAWTTFREKSGDTSPQIAYCCIASAENTSSGGIHTCVLSVRGTNPRNPQWSWHCGDAGLTGDLSKTDYLTSVERAAAGVQPERRARLAAMMAASYGIQTKNTGCNFWQRNAKGQVCKHLAAFFDQVGEWSPSGDRNRFLGAMAEEWSAWVPQ
jgi:hypothetical protein